MTNKNPVGTEDLENVSGGTNLEHDIDTLQPPGPSDNLENCCGSPYEPKSRYRHRKQGKGPKIPLY